MGDYFPAYIRIGGKIDAAGAEDLLGACENDNAWHDYDTRPELLGTPIEKLTQLFVLAQDGDPNVHHLILRNSQARNGCFGDVEDICSRLSLPYERHSDAYADASSAWEIWRPGRPYPFFIASDQDANRLINADIVLRAYKALMEGCYHEALHFLHPLVSPLIELGELPPFVIET